MRQGRYGGTSGMGGNYGMLSSGGYQSHNMGNYSGAMNSSFASDDYDDFGDNSYNDFSALDRYGGPSPGNYLDYGY